MLTLYVKTGCPYCTKVIDKLKELEIPYSEKNIIEEEYAVELLKLGGKEQVPYMDDDDPCSTAKHHTPCLLSPDVEMYESDEIVEYLDKNYGSVGGEAKKGADVETSKGETCDS